MASAQAHSVLLSSNDMGAGISKGVENRTDTPLFDELFSECCVLFQWHECLKVINAFEK